MRGAWLHSPGAGPREEGEAGAWGFCLVPPLNSSKVAEAFPQAPLPRPVTPSLPTPSPDRDLRRQQRRLRQ